MLYGGIGREEEMTSVGTFLIIVQSVYLLILVPLWCSAVWYGTQAENDDL